MKKQKKQKVRIISIKNKILIPCILLITIICTVLGISSYKKIKEGMLQMAVDQASVAANITSSIVDWTNLEIAIKNGYNSAEYNKIQSSMKFSKENCNIKYLYTLYTDGEKVYCGIDVDDTEDDCVMGSEFEIPYEELKTVFDGKEYVEQDISESEYGTLITVYKPIFNSENKVIGVIGSDFNASTVQNRLNKALQNVITISIICLIISILILGVIINGIMHSLEVINGKIYDLVNNEGDLTQTIEMKTGDELEIIAYNINIFLEYIRNIMLHISNNSNCLNMSTQKVAQNLLNSEEHITDISATIEEMSASMEETTRSLNQINNSIIEAFETVEIVASKTSESKNSSERMNKNANEIYISAKKDEKIIKGKINTTFSVINEKIKRSKAVEEINILTENIINITEQTTLLALNAHIEAARAGEAGRGFSVVANEIGQLANNSSEAASQIKNVSTQVITAVNELAEETKEMMKFMDNVTQNAYKKLEDISENYQYDAMGINENMQQFSDIFVQLHSNMDIIKNAVSTVNNVVENSTKRIGNISEMSVNLLTGIEKINDEASSNKNIANQLNDEVMKFKI